MNAKSRFVGLMLIVMLLTTGCSNSAAGTDPAPVATPVVSVSSETNATAAAPTPSPTPEPTANPLVDASFVFPDPAIRPVGVMIDNQGERPLPQAGIRQAQIVYEVLTEYEITRYFALFWGTMPDMIGPVRSSRHYFLDFAMEYDAVYTHFGWSPKARSDISALKINNINGLVQGDAFWDTDSNKGNWQDSFTSREKVEYQITKLKYATTPKKTFPFVYTDNFTIPATGASGKQIDIKFGKGNFCSYTYNEQTGLYDRFHEGDPHMERNTGLQVTVRNILIQKTPSERIAGDKEGRINVQTVGSGTGYFVTGGKSQNITWSKKARDAQVVYKLENGESFVLNPGQTWIEIVPTKADVVIQ